jgi:hypothetical protein
MNIDEEIAFCKMRIEEQDEYLDDLDFKHIHGITNDVLRYEELENSANIVKERFEKRLKQLEYEKASN